MGEYLDRAVVRGKPLDKDCKRANVSKHEYGPNDNRCFCYGTWPGRGRKKVIE